MPYRPDELEDLTIYTNFRDKLRSGYIKNIIQGALNKFRNKENFLLSYEDLDTGKGIESATFTNNSTYSTLETQLDVAELEASDFGVSQTVAFSSDPDFIPASEGFMKRITEYSKTIQTGQLRKNIKTAQLDNFIDRSISELFEPASAITLPTGIENGMYVTLQNVKDTRKWKIEENQKRIFSSLSSFYGSSADWSDLKTTDIDTLNTIPDGEPID